MVLKERERRLTDRVVWQRSDIDEIWLLVINAIKRPGSAAGGIHIDGEAKLAPDGVVARHVPVGCGPILLSSQCRHMAKGNWRVQTLLLMWNSGTVPYALSGALASSGMMRWG